MAVSQLRAVGFEELKVIEFVSYHLNSHFFAPAFTRASLRFDEKDLINLKSKIEGLTVSRSSTQPIPRFLSLAKAARECGLSVFAIRQGVKNGDIPTVIISKRRLINSQALASLGAAKNQGRRR